MSTKKKDSAVGEMILEKREKQSDPVAASGYRKHPTLDRL